MEERIILKGDFSKVNTLAMICFCVSIVSIVVAFVLGNMMHEDESFVETYLFPQGGEGSAVFFWLALVLIIIGVYFLLKMKTCEITVTDKRVYGRASFGKLVDLPLDKISSVGVGFPKCVAVATSSGIIKFWLINNQDDVYRAISSLLQSRQEPKESVIVSEKSEAEEIKKFKELLDQGIISKEEFDSKKKQLLGL